MFEKMVLNLTSFSQVLAFTQVHGYLVLFLLLIFGGPVVTIAASFGASLGYLNIWIVGLIAFCGDAVGDALIYSFGYFGRKKIIDEYGNLFGIKIKSLSRLESHFEKHLGKTLFFLKMTPLAVPGIMLAGVGRVPVKRYAMWNAIIIVPKVIFFTGLGYFFGFVADSFLKTYKNVNLYILALAIVSLFVYWLGKKISEAIVSSEDSLKKDLKKAKLPKTKKVIPKKQSSQSL